MANDDLIKYLIKRLDTIEAKVDKLSERGWFAYGVYVGIATVVSGIVSILVHLIK